jgi:hypothetical protein
MTSARQPHPQRCHIDMEVVFPDEVNPAHIEEYIRKYIRADGWGESFASNYIHIERIAFTHTSAPSQPTLYKTQTDDDGAIGKVAICLCEQCKVNGFLCIKSPRAIGVPSAKVQQCIAAVIGELEAMEEKSTSNDIVSAGYRTGLRKAIALLQAGRK